MSRRSLALLASLLVHAAAVVLLVRSGERRLRAPPKPVEIEIVQTPPKPVPVVAPPPAPEPKPEPPKPKPPPVKPKAPAPKPAVPPPTAPEPPTPPPSPEETHVEPAPSGGPPPDAPVSDLPRAPRLDLTPSSQGLAFKPPENTPDAGMPDDLQKTASDRIHQMLGEAEARGRVERGMVDPYFGALGKALLKQWDAESHVKTNGLKGFTQQLMENNRAWGRIWQNRAADYGKSGSPLAPGTMDPAIVERTGNTTGIAAKAAYNRQLREQFMESKRATIRVVQGLDGKLRDITLVKPSNDPSLDKEAMADVRRAAEKLPPPPADGAGIHDPIVSLWEFELVISISPPVPTVQFEFDEALGFFDTRLPLDRRIYKRIRLVGVE